ncbi:hypothetical protein FNV43_RR17570 [Rhamnella rubrinervis]|uniref:DOG1 domain-containing protein n=1 Tax=Rhamnella rubrinervis TaxID=2594499 RepID=A0A8K0E4G1_9ROSA|nr:hypothetical protein FNV43_RR17570 [Rhamnella rubrinervis]
MSAISSTSSTYLSSPIGDIDNTTEQKNFQVFFEFWLVEQDKDLQDLISVAKDHQRVADDTDDAVLGSLIERVVQRYENYYRAKSMWAKRDVLRMLSPSWLSSLEDAFLWIGGWRPSMAFHLLYSKSGLQLEDRLGDLIRGMVTGDLADLSPEQMTRVDTLQRRTIWEEKEITEKMAKHQESLADSSMVELSHVVSEFMRSGDEDGGNGAHSDRERVESTLAPKEEGLKVLLQRADDLRLKTLKDIVGVLTPIQAVHFLIAAAELHLRLHEWGKRTEAPSHGDHN